MTNASSPRAVPGSSPVADTLADVVDTLEDPQYQQSSPSFQPLNRVDVAVIVVLYVLLPVLLAIAVFI